MSSYILPFLFYGLQNRFRLILQFISCCPNRIDCGARGLGLEFWVGPNICMIDNWIRRLGLFYVCYILKKKYINILSVYLAVTMHALLSLKLTTRLCQMAQCIQFPKHIIFIILHYTFIHSYLKTYAVIFDGSTISISLSLILNQNRHVYLFVRTDGYVMQLICYYI